MTLIQRLAAATFAACLMSPLPPAAAAVPKPPVMRLGDAVKPLAYDLAVTMVPSAAGFDGRVEIDVDIQRPLDFFWMNGAGLTVKRATLSIDGKTLNAKAVQGGEHFLGLQFAQRVPAGKGRLSIDYSGRYSTNETRGFFKQQTGGDWYAFSQFEAISARRAFPCFDEPHWKTPWTVTLNVKREHVAVSNTAAVSEENVGTDMKRVRFAKTLPLPTYLVAVGVGPFDVVDGGTAGMNKTPLRYIVPKGHAAETGFAQRSTPQIVSLLEDYFGRPYPYPKLDSMVIPITVGFGAMENPGLITYKSSLMLIKPDREDERSQQRYAGVAAHEIAHQWFGDLVTMQWWNDLWLNESFATWMGRKTLQQFNPSWESHQWREHERQVAFQTDRLSSTRQIRQDINTPDDLGNAFDRITYDKGGAVLTMFETWLGETGFRDGVRRYLKRHEYGNATAEDFFSALAESDPELAKGFASFVAQPGLPLVDVKIDCTGGKPAVNLRQKRFLPALGDKAANTQRWIAPVCMRYDGQASAQPFCTVLREAEQRVELPEANSCPAWLLPNPGGAGYFLSSIDAANAKALVQARLSAPEAVSLLGDMSLLADSGVLPVSRLLDAVGVLASDARPEVVKAAAETVKELNPALFDDAGRQQLAAWVREHFGKRAAEVGWIPREADSDALRKLRAELLPLVTQIGRDPERQAEARKLAYDWIGGNRKQLGSVFRNVLKSAAYDGDAKLFDAMANAALTADDSDSRIETYKALGNFRDPALRERAFKLALSDKADLREAEDIYEGAGEQPANAQALLRFVRDNFATLQRRLPEESMARLPRRHHQLCSAQDRAELEAVYRGKLTKVPGGERNLAQALETVDICIANRKAQQAVKNGAPHAN